MDRAILRSRLLARVEKHDGHWIWTGNTAVGSEGQEVPRIQDRGAPYSSARRLAYEIFVGPVSKGDRVSTCDDLLCIAPRCLVKKTRGICAAGHRHEGDCCTQCKLAQQAVRIACEGCGRSISRSNMARHRRVTCKPPEQPRKTQHHRSEEERAQLADDVAADLAAGLTPEGICDAYDTTPGGMDAALRRLGRPELARPFQRLEYHQRQEQARDS